VFSAALLCTYCKQIFVAAEKMGAKGRIGVVKWWNLRKGFRPLISKR
jgi:hypothetical protein